MWLEDEQWPWPHHPVTAGNDGMLEVYDDVTVPAFQVRPLTVELAAAWCNAAVVMVNGGPALIVGGGVAGLGDFVVEVAAGDYVAVPAAEMPQRYVAA